MLSSASNKGTNAKKMTIVKCQYHDRESKTAEKSPNSQLFSLRCIAPKIIQICAWLIAVSEYV
jgi:hypothetical protein